MQRALGVPVDPELSDREVYDTAEGVVRVILELLSPGDRCYAWTSGLHRVKKEAFACTTSRGTRLVTLPNRVPITGGTLKKTYKWG